MTLRAVVRKDLRVARADGDLTGYAVMFALVGVAVGYADANAPADATSVAALLVAALAFLLPLVALLTAYDTVAAERETGSVRLLLTLPHRRSEVVFGTFLGRTAMNSVHAVAAVTAAVVVGVALGGVDAAELLGAVAVLVPLALLGAAFVAIGVGVSASVASGRTALTGAIAVGLGSVAIWDPLAAALRYVAAGFQSPTGPAPAWTAALPHLSPADAFQRTAALFLAELDGGSVTGPLVLVGWTVVPLLAGRYRFERTPI